ncbi:uncharacterized protein PSFLO_06734 [Pseudozyma flocculosa]|uniref:Uncharacterized protein n=1 Tax=Pseudozyma flocculosa TaxID=84751 RepID=A0A5C3FA02_9BASI|nr:uncharacterized protein PSFLO_06734 [Pseudozyma flocculosa]
MSSAATLGGYLSKWACRQVYDVTLSVVHRSSPYVEFPYGQSRRPGAIRDLSLAPWARLAILAVGNPGLPTCLYHDHDPDLDSICPSTAWPSCSNPSEILADAPSSGHPLPPFRPATVPRYPAAQRSRTYG